MSAMWRVFVYRKLAAVDVDAALVGNFGLKRFEALSGTEVDMRDFYDSFAASDQVLAVELIDPNGRVDGRRDNLINLIGQLRTGRSELAELVLQQVIMAAAIPPID